jgi:hypothetical protein
MLKLIVCINRIEIWVNRPLGDVEKKFENWCTSQFGLRLDRPKGISESLYVVQFGIGRDAKEINANVTSFLEANGLQVELKFEL